MQPVPWLQRQRRLQIRQLCRFCSLSYQILGDVRLASISTLLYCFNPASIFYTALYTESFFACVSLIGLLVLDQHSWLSTASWYLAAGTRSNGKIHVLLRMLLKLQHLHTSSTASVCVILLAATGILYCGFILHRAAFLAMKDRRHYQVWQLQVVLQACDQILLFSATLLPRALGCVLRADGHQDMRQSCFSVCHCVSSHARAASSWLEGLLSA